MRNSGKILAVKKITPFTGVYALRCEIIANHTSKEFYIIPDTAYLSWGISVEVKEGFTAPRPDSSYSLSFSKKDGHSFWVSNRTRPPSLEYTFHIYQDEKIYETYKVIVIL